MPYLIILLIFFLQYLYMNRYENKIKFTEKEISKRYLIITCVELVLFVGLREYHIGADTIVYVDALDYYKSLPKMELLTAPLVPPFDFEIGYFLLTKFFAFFNTNDTLFLMFIGMIIYIPVFMFIYRYSNKPFLSLLIYFSFDLFAYSLGIFRQMIALSITLIGFHFILENKFIKYLITIFIAFLFHRTAIVMLPLFIFYNYKSSLKYVAFIGFEFVFLFFGRNIIDLIIKIFPSYSNLVGSIYDIEGGSYFALLLYIAILLVLLYLQKNQKDVNLTFSIDLMCILLLIQTLAYSFGIFGRITPYFNVFLLIIIPKILSCFDQESYPSLNLILYPLLFLIFYITVSGNQYILPFKFFFQVFFNLC